MNDAKNDKKKIQRKIERVNKKIKQLKEKHGENPTTDFNYYGGWNLGYWEGVLSVLEEMMDEVDEGEIEVGKAI